MPCVILEHAPKNDLKNKLFQNHAGDITVLASIFRLFFSKKATLMVRSRVLPEGEAGSQGN